MAQTLGVVAALAIVTLAISASFHTQTASAYPSYAQDCTACHGTGAVSGTVIATPSTATPAAGGAYTVPVNISMNAGSTGYWIANSDAAGTTGTSVVSGGGPGSSSLTYPVPMTAPAAAGTYYYKVWAVRGPPDSTGQANFALYNITVGSAPAGPNITAVAPTHGLAGSTVTITGTALGTAGAVTIGGLTAATTAWSATSITATVPALAAGAADVIVTPTGATASNTATYTVDAATDGPGPTPGTANITAVAPTHGLAGSTVAITGTDLGTGGAVTIGGLTAATTAWSATSITATVPALAAGAADVIVTPTGATASNTATYTVDAATDGPGPTPGTAHITELSPNQGRVGTKVTITGTDFGSKGKVRFGNVKAKVISWTDTAIVVKVRRGHHHWGWDRCTPKTITDPVDLSDGSDGIRTAGSAVDDQESEGWLRCFGQVLAPLGTGVVPVTVTPRGGEASNSVDFQIVRGRHDEHGDDEHGDGDHGRDDGQQSEQSHRDSGAVSPGVEAGLDEDN